MTALLCAVFGVGADLVWQLRRVPESPPTVGAAGGLPIPIDAPAPTADRSRAVSDTTHPAVAMVPPEEVARAPRWVPPEDQPRGYAPEQLTRPLTKIQEDPIPPNPFVPPPIKVNPYPENGPASP